MPRCSATVRRHPWVLAVVATGSVGSTVLRRTPTAIMLPASLTRRAGSRRYSGVAEGTLRIGVVDLVHEVDNPHDRDAISIVQDGLHVGYFNKGMAPGLAKALDRGQDLHGVGISPTRRRSL